MDGWKEGWMVECLVTRESTEGPASLSQDRKSVLVVPLPPESPQLTWFRLR